jgi:hypothetical protein
MKELMHNNKYGTRQNWLIYNIAAADDHSYTVSLPIITYTVLLLMMITVIPYCCC